MVADAEIASSASQLSAQEEVARYRKELRALVMQHGLGNPEKWKHYQKLQDLNLIKESVLQDASKSMDVIRVIFKETYFGDCEVQYRKPKVMERVNRKREKGASPFKLVNDYTAFRVVVEHKYWPSDRMYQIRQLVSAIAKKRNGAVIGYKFPKEDELYDANKIAKDLVDVLYIFLPEVGHLTECQIMHPFPDYVFHYNSENRGHFFRRLSKSGFFNKVRDRILNPEGEKRNDGDGENTDFVKELKRIEGDHVVVEKEHPNLIRILEQIQGKNAVVNGKD